MDILNRKNLPTGRQAKTKTKIYPVKFRLRRISITGFDWASKTKRWCAQLFVAPFLFAFIQKRKCAMIEDIKIKK